MNKAIIININGIIFHIEEEAYEVLQAYMVEVKKHFGYSIDSQEIVGDIENRIAEMFSERLNEHKAVILLEDVNEVCAQMGNVKDFEVDEDSNDEFAQESAYSYNEERSLFRDPNDKVLGGVCAGLGHYFEIESKWVRLIFLLLFIFGGAGFLIYIILWIVLPKAKTRADKMRMRGEPANLESFKRSFNEEMGDVKRNFSEVGERTRAGLTNPDSGINSFINAIGKIIIVFVKIIGALIIFCLSLTLVSLIIAMVVGPDFWWGSRPFGSNFPLFAVESQFRNALMIAVCLVMAIPLLILILLAIRVIFDRKVIGRYFGFSLLIIWLIAVGFSIFYITKTAIDFKEEATITQETRLTPKAVYKLGLRENNTVIIKKEGELDSLDGFTSTQKSIRHNERSFFNHYNRISFSIEKSNNDQLPKLIEDFSAKGRTFEVAAERAGRIGYKINQEDETLWFASSSILPKGEVIRDQKVYVRLFLPLGTRLFISKEFERHINIRGLSYWECENSYPENEKPNETEWIMTENGLKCVADNPQLITPNPIDSIQRDSSVTTTP